MRRMLACAGLLALVATVPAAAARLYVPVLGQGADGTRLATSVWATGMAGSSRAIAARGADGAARDFPLADGAQPLAGLTRTGEEGLVALEAPAAAVSAWLASDAQGAVAELPVISADDAYAPGAAPALALADDGGALRVATANLDERAATCSATLEDAAGAVLATRALAVGPQALAHVDFAAGERRGAATARVRCDRTFYPLAVTTAGDGLGVVVGKATGPNGACDRWLTLARQPDGSYLTQTAGIFHQATSANPKGILCIKTPATLQIARAVYDWDVTAGPWYPKKPSGIHNLGYFFSERYRSGVIGNVNATGTKGGLRIMQNYSLPPGHNSAGGVQYKLQRGALYHATYTFDASAAAATLQLYRNGTEVKAFGIGTAPAGRTLVVSPYGTGAEAGLALVAEFGNYAIRGLPEVPTLGWTYGNFRLHLFPK